MIDLLDKQHIDYTRVVRMVKPNAIANKIRETVQQVKR